jgi:hypothetical protein
MSKAGSLASRLKCHGTVFSLVYTSAKKHWKSLTILVEHYRNSHCWQQKAKKLLRYHWRPW